MRSLDRMRWILDAISPFAHSSLTRLDIRPMSQIATLLRDRFAVLHWTERKMPLVISSLWHSRCIIFSTLLLLL